MTKSARGRTADTAFEHRSGSVYLRIEHGSDEAMSTLDVATRVIGALGLYCAERLLPAWWAQRAAANVRGTR